MATSDARDRPRDDDYDMFGAASTDDEFDVYEMCADETMWDAKTNTVTTGTSTFVAQGRTRSGPPWRRNADALVHRARLCGASF